MRRWSAFFSLVVLLLFWGAPRAVFSQTPVETKRILIDANDTQALDHARQDGGMQLADYGAFTLWQIPAQSIQAAAEMPAASPAAVQVDDTLYLRGAALRFGSGGPAVPAQLSTLDSGGEGLWIVQYAGPIQPQWLDDLQSAGLEVVTYLPNNAYLVWGQQPAAALDALAANQPLIQWRAPYQPFYRLAPALRDTAGTQSTSALDNGSDITVQFYNTSHLKDSLARLEALAGRFKQAPDSLLHITNVRARVPTQSLSEIAAWPDVVNIEPDVPPQMLDESQGQLLAGNLAPNSTSAVPSGPGYLSWLQSKGFPADPNAYPIVDVVDDGLDAGNAAGIVHPDFYRLGNKANGARVAYINNCSSDAAGNSTGGHGNLNAGILAGYNTLSSAPHRDAKGYQLDLGISPFGRIASSKVFSNTGAYELTNCGGSASNQVIASYASGARITSNSWGAASNGEYDITAQTYDVLTRDASPAAGNQEMLHIFAAGNSGSAPSSIDSPGTAKNVLTVGATENVRDNGIQDGCLVTNAQNANNIASFSSRGPAKDGRIKPDIVAPGTHVTGPASQDPGYTGNSVCGGKDYNNNMARVAFYPVGQNLYTWSSGTSHATPAIGGVAQLVYNYYQRVLSPGSTPSPAMLKALILNTPRYLTGDGANDTLPSANQGWGSTDMNRIFDGTPRILVDQSHLFTATGQTFHILGHVADPSKPFRVSLVWTDAPGAPSSGSAAVNNLDLEVSVQQQIYRGNVFKGAYSNVGGQADPNNNVESVFLPSGTSGDFHVRVIVRNLAGDGVPGNSSQLDQDFALVINNGVQVAAPVLAVQQVHWSEISGHMDGIIDPGDKLSLNVSLSNQGSLTATQVQGQVVSLSSGATVMQSGASFATLAPGGSALNQGAYQVQISSIQRCGAELPMAINLSYNNFQDQLPLPALPIGRTVSHAFAASKLPTAIPDYLQAPGQALIPITVQESFPIGDLQVQVDIAHSWDADLNLMLISPNNQMVKLSTGNGGMLDNYHNTVFDDHAALPITGGLPPFTGHFKPQQPLSVFSGQDTKGTWTLVVQDMHEGDTGQVLSFSLVARSNTCFSNNTLYWLPAITKGP